MDALLVLNETNSNVRVLVTLKHKPTKEKVISLLEENRSREAFELLKSRAEVQVYLPLGSRLPRMPHVTLIEDLL